ncbi:MAG: glycosyltransferase [Desulfovibrionaceae bacterium]|nr:glycosyltransferase [Desulfovibrionaceae bacterium]
MRLLVIVPDRLSSILDKGEFQPDYYNPGNLADEAHLLMTNDDKPDPAPLQYTVGTAKLFLHNYPDDLTLPQKPFPFLDRWRLNRWARDGVKLIASIAPDMIRCHGADWNAYLASRAKAALGIPYCVSLHTQPDTDIGSRMHIAPTSTWQKRSNAFYDTVACAGLRQADFVLPVYQNILPYCRRLGIPEERIRVCYNVLNKFHLVQKTDYALHNPARILYVGRLVESKNPENIIRAIAGIANCRLTIIGHGPEGDSLKKLVKSLTLTKKVSFIDSLPNDELCQFLPQHDLFVIHNEYWGISKTTLEAMLTGLPVIINHRAGEPVAELQGGSVRLVENTPEAYRNAIIELLTDVNTRESLGKRAFLYSRANYDPALTEEKYVRIYQQMIENRPDR